MYAFRPQCRKCGALTFLASIQPTSDAEHDLRTFECENCGEVEVVRIRLE
jgi:predicted RNA-binding Zn-ribbon protein involved in translation (DUF1610 family)